MRHRIEEVSLSEATPPPTDPLSIAAAVSVGFTPQMHTETANRIEKELRDSKLSLERTNPHALDLFETVIYHAAYSENPGHALHIYDWQLGGYKHFGGRLGDYRRGLRITAFLMQVLGADYMDVIACPAHDYNLYRIALGDHVSAEQDTRRLLAHAKNRAQTSQDDPREDNWHNPLRYFKNESDRGFAMYEVILLQTRCDALLMQGKLSEAEAIMNQVLNNPHEWDTYGRPEKRQNGSNPYARRALARALSGEVDEAFADFKAADQFSAEHTQFFIFKSRDWHHRTLYPAFLARLGYLSGAQSRLDRMNIERIRAYRPLTSAEFDLSSAEIAYARANYDQAKEHAERVLNWAETSGHKQMHTRATIVLAKTQIRLGGFKNAEALLREAFTEADEAGFALQKVDSLILTGHLALRNGDSKSAEYAAIEAETISEPLPYRWGIGDALHLRARCLESLGEIDAALEYARRAVSLREQLQDPKVRYTQTFIERLSPYENLSEREDTDGLP
jgi:tetratricopeptide (TPR) repeat protein